MALGFRSFRAKLTAILLTVVIGVTAGLLLVVQEGVRQVFNDAQQESFAAESQAYRQRDSAQREELSDELAALARHPRLLAAVEIGPDDAYNNFYHDLAQLMEDFLSRLGTEKKMPFVRLLHWEGGYAPVPDNLESLGRPLPRDFLGAVLSPLASDSERPGQLRAGFLPIGATLYFVVVQPFVDPDGLFWGDLLLGVPLERIAGSTQGVGFYPGLYQNGEFHPLSERISSASISEQVIEAALDLGQRDAEFHDKEDAFRAFFLALPTDHGFPPTELVALFPLDGRAQVQARIRLIILLAAAVALLGAYVISALVSQRVTRPLEALAMAAHRVERGDYTIQVPHQGQDEVSRLTLAFNEMTTGLALKERYRAVLDKVADPDVASQLTQGSLELGGEERSATVLFCDIRGFTAMTEHLSPHEVITLLNEHMTALTEVVYAHGGVVDKFVGDEVMALFGVPQPDPEAATKAAQAAAAMLAARTRLNKTAQHPCEIGIGIASGEVVAGLMGSESRLQYTVVGARVNLAARLCSRAQPGCCLLDDLTSTQLDAGMIQKVGDEMVRSFSQPVGISRLLLPEKLSAG